MKADVQSKCATLLCPVEARLAAVIAGTLCLMSCYRQYPLALHAERIAANLELLAANAALSGELRDVCRRLAERWEAIVADARHRALHNGAPADQRALH